MAATLSALNSVGKLLLERIVDEGGGFLSPVLIYIISGERMKPFINSQSITDIFIDQGTLFST